MVTAGIDTYIYNWFPGVNFSSDPKLLLHSPDIASILIDFDFSSIPADATVTNATLRLHVLDQTLTDTVKIEVYPLLRLWNAQEATWEQAANDDPWASPGASGAPDRTRLPSAISLAVIPGEDAILDLTSIVQVWRLNPDSQHGLLLALRTTTGEQTLRIAGFAYSLPGWRPRLEVSVLGWQH